MKLQLSQKLLSLRRALSAGASINEATEANFKVLSARWSDITAVTPGALINVATEQDVVTSITWATKNNAPFLLQGGGHGWQMKLRQSGVVINTRPLASVAIDAAAGTATIGAGTLVGEATAAAHAARVHLPLATCASIGVVGSTLGGRVGTFYGLYGLGIDSLLSARVVTAAGELLTINAESHPNLWHALRGAGNALVAVTEITMRAYPEINGGRHFKRELVFAPSAIETVVKAINALPRIPHARVKIFMTSPAPAFTPTLMLSLWYAGAAAEGLKYFAPLLAFGLILESDSADGMISVDRLNSDADVLAAKGGRKPAGGVMLKDLDPKAIRACWNTYASFARANPGATQSVVSIQVHDVAKALELESQGGGSAYPHRNLGILASVLAKYGDAKLDAAAREFVEEVLEALSSNGEKAVYCNFARGGEKLGELFGNEGRVERLKEIKRIWDPKNQFQGFASLA